MSFDIEQYSRLGIAGLETLVRLQPENPEAQLYLGLSYLDAGRAEDARLSFEQALAIKKDYGEAQGYLGAALQELGRYEEAVTMLRAALDYRDRYEDGGCFEARVYGWLALTLLRMERYQEAAAAAWESMRLSSDLVEVQWILADLSVHREVQIPRPANFRPPYFDQRLYCETDSWTWDVRVRLFHAEPGPVALVSADSPSSGPGPMFAAEDVCRVLLPQADRFGIGNTLTYIAHFSGLLGQQLNCATFHWREPAQGSLLRRLFTRGKPVAAPDPWGVDFHGTPFRPMSMKEFEELTGFRLEWEVSEAGAV